MLLVSLALDLLLAWLLLRRARLGVPGLLRVGSWGLALAVAQGALAAVLFQSAFLAIRLVHAWIFLALPVVCLAVLLAARRRGATTAARVTATAGALALPALFLWTSAIEPFDLRLERVDVPLAAGRAPAEPLRIGVLADLQCEAVGAHERRAVDTLMAQRPDLILVPGDLEQVFSTEAFDALEPSLHELVAQLDAPLGVYMVVGNCDALDGTQRLLEDTRVRMLMNESVHLEHAGRAITLCGLSLSVDSPRAQAALAELERREGDDLRIVLAHYPDAVLQLPEGTRVDLVVAGHTHGGQVRLPWFGPLITLSRVPRHVAGGGLHELNGTRIYVSRGVGVERGDAPRIRFNCPPEVSLLTLGANLSP